ncbi:6-carboxytetrahydropterin synthase QueD [candidate division KSB1 bacterium]|nr:6-carboxytetrahydropterin synthase QueD [candidate division KSB1 bacterium]
MYKLCVQSEFSAAHKLNLYQGECQRIHGHNWKVEATVAGKELDELGMAIDLLLLEKLLQECLHQFDHRMLNEVQPFDKMNPTSENLARYIFHWLRDHLPGKVWVDQVRIYETDRLSVTYSEDDVDR